MKIFLRDTTCCYLPKKFLFRSWSTSLIVKSVPNIRKCLNSVVWIKAWGVFLMFGRFGRKILGDEFWPYVASRKSLEVISFVFSDIFNFKYHKNTRNSRILPKSYNCYNKVVFFLIFVIFKIENISKE